MEARWPHWRSLFSAFPPFLICLSVICLTAVTLLAGESVDPRSGKLQLAETDLTLPSGSVLLSIERVYDPGPEPAGLLGHGWWLGLEKHLTRTGDKAVLRNGNQSTQFQRQPGAAAYTSGTGEELTFATDGKAVLKKADASLETYDASGRLLEQRFRIGNVVRFQYDASGRLARIDGAGGSFYKFSADRSARITRIESSSGMAVVYRYTSGNLTDVQVDQRPAIRYGYDAKSRLTRIEDPYNGNVELAYDDKDRVVSRKPAGITQARYEYDDAAGTIRYIDSAGGITTTRFSAGGTQREITGPLGQKTLIRVDDGSRKVSITSPSGAISTLRYDSLGRLISSAKEKEEIRLEYVGQTQLTAAISYPDGSRQSFEYDNDHNLTAIREGQDIVSQFTYNEDGMPASAKYEGRGEWRYLYDPDGHLKAQTDAEGQTTRFEYDRHGNVVRRIDPAGGAISFAYDEQDRLVSHTDPAGATTKYIYDPAGRLLQRIDALGGITGFEYDIAGRLGAYTDAAGKITRYGYDAAGRRVSITYPGGAIYKYDYDAAGNVISALNPLGGVTRYRYNAENKLTSVTDPTGRTWKYEFTSQGRLSKIISPAGETTEFHYDASGQNQGFSDPAGRTVGFERDARGRFTKVALPNGGVRTVTYDKEGNLVGVTDNQGGSLTYENDALGRTALKKDSAGLEITNRFDAAGHLAGLRDNLGSSLLIRHTLQGQISALTDSTGATTQFGYDLAGRLTEVADPLQRIKRLVYSAGGELTRVEEPNGDSAQFDYDGAGRVSVIHHPGGGVTRFEYDAMDHPLRISDPLGNQTRFTYDEAGRINAITEPDGRTTSLFYDLAGRLSKRQHPDGKLVTFKYNPSGKITEVDDGQYPVRYAYDILGRTTAVEYPAVRKQQRYEYDSTGLLAKITHPDGRVIRYAYDEHKRVIAIQLADNSTIRFGYDVGGRLVSVFYPNGVKGTWEYSPSGKLSRIAYSNSSGQLLCGWSYAYDLTGNLTSVTDSQGRATKYDYDASGQLVKEDGAAGTIRYGYAPGGNRATREAGGQTLRYEYDSADQLLRAGDETFSYDKRGNLIERKSPGGVTRYSYDDNNRLVRVILPDGREVSFGYSPAGDRIWRRDRTGTTYFVTDGINTLAELDENYNPRVSYIYAPGIDNPIAMIDGQRSLFYHTDRLGSVAALSDSAGKLAATYQTDAFGVPSSVPKGTPNRFIFTAREYEADLWLYYYRARFYDPALGRFLTRDPVMGSLTQVASLNPYAYVSNNPIRFADPLGLEKKLVFQKVNVPLQKDLIAGTASSTCPYCQQAKDVGKWCLGCETVRANYGSPVLDDETIANTWELDPEQVSDLADFYEARHGGSGSRGGAFEAIKDELLSPSQRGLKGMALYERIRDNIYRSTEGVDWDVARAETGLNAQTRAQWEAMMARGMAGELPSANPNPGSAIATPPPESPAPPPPNTPSPEAIAAAESDTSVLKPPGPLNPNDLTTKIPTANPEAGDPGLGPYGRGIAKAGAAAGLAGLGLHGYADYVETGSSWEAAKRAAWGTIKGTAVVATVALVSAPAAVAGGVAAAGYGIYTGIERVQYDNRLAGQLNQLEATLAAETANLTQLRDAATNACLDVKKNLGVDARAASAGAQRDLDALRPLVGSAKGAFSAGNDAAGTGAELDSLSSRSAEIAGTLEQKITDARQQAAKCESEPLVRTAQANCQASRDLLDQLNQLAKDARSKAGALKSIKERVSTAREALATARQLKDRITTEVKQFTDLFNAYPSKVDQARGLKAEYEQRRAALMQRFYDFRGNDPQALPPAFERRFTEIRARANQIPETIVCTWEQESLKSFGTDPDQAKAIQTAAEGMLTELETAAAACSDVPSPDDRLQSIENSLANATQLAADAQDLPALLSKCLEKLAPGSTGTGGFKEVGTSVSKGASAADNPTGGFKEVGSTVQLGSVKWDAAPGTQPQNQPVTGGGAGPGPGGGQSGGNAPPKVRPSATIAAGQPAAYHIFATGSRLGWAGGLAQYSEGPSDQAIVDHLVTAGEHVMMANRESYLPTKAWPNWADTKAQFTSWAQNLARTPTDPARRSLAMSASGVVPELAARLSYQTVGTPQQMANCDAAYMRLGFQMAYGQQALLIADEAARGRNSQLATRARQDGISHLQAADQILVDYENIKTASGSCADLKDVRKEIESLIPSWDMQAQAREATQAWQLALDRIRSLLGQGTPNTQIAAAALQGTLQPATNAADPGELEGEWLNCTGTCPPNAEGCEERNKLIVLKCLETRMSTNDRPDSLWRIRFVKNGNQYSSEGFREIGARAGDSRSGPMILTRTGANTYEGKVYGSAVANGVPTWIPLTGPLVVEGDVARNPGTTYVRAVPFGRAAAPQGQPSPPVSVPAPKTVDPGELRGEWFECDNSGITRWYLESWARVQGAELLNKCLQLRTSRPNGYPDFTVSFSGNGNQYIGIITGSLVSMRDIAFRSTGLDSTDMATVYARGAEMFRLTKTGPNSYEGQELVFMQTRMGLAWFPSRLVVEGDVATEQGPGPGALSIHKWVRVTPGGSGKKQGPEDQTISRLQEGSDGISCRICAHWISLPGVPQPDCEDSRRWYVDLSGR